jgi:DNA-binding transcriptional MocR family regulator
MLHFVTMTIWKAVLDSDTGPLYLAIADAIARDVEAGVLRPGARLPTHRSLADTLGVTVGTITRAYAEAERRGLTVGEVGRGTFVRERSDPGNGGWGGGQGERGVVDMSLSTPWVPPDGSDGRELARTLRAVAAGAGLDELLRYHPESALLRHRRTAAGWLGRMGVDVPAEQVVVTAGAQHAVQVILGTFLSPGDTLLTADLTYPGTKALAQMLGIRIQGVALDGEGIDPAALDAACRDGARAALYCIPTLHNPTCATMSAERRRSIVAVAREHDLLVIEDEVHAALDGQDVPTLASLAPERTFYLATLSKRVTFGLRVAFVAPPAGAGERLRAGVRSSVWMPPPLMVEIAARWLEDGTAQRMSALKLEELAARHELVEAAFEGVSEVRADPRSPHAWLLLREPWSSHQLVAVARQRGVLVAGAEAFAVGRREIPHAVRVSFGAVPRRSDLKRGLGILADVLTGSTEPYAEIL